VKRGLRQAGRIRPGRQLQTHSLLRAAGLLPLRELHSGGLPLRLEYDNQQRDKSRQSYSGEPLVAMSPPQDSRTRWQKFEARCPKCAWIVDQLDTLAALVGAVILAAWKIGSELGLVSDADPDVLYSTLLGVLALLALAILRDRMHHGETAETMNNIRTTTSDIKNAANNTKIGIEDMSGNIKHLTGAIASIDQRLSAASELQVIPPDEIQSAFFGAMAETAV
jgi:hypothetical protein